MGLQISAMIVGLLLVSAAGMWGLNGLRTDFRLALAGFDFQRRGDEIGMHLAAARTILQLDPLRRDAAQIQVKLAADKFHMMQSGQNTTFVTPGGWQQNLRDLGPLSEALSLAQAQLGKPAANPPDAATIDADVQAVDVALGGISAFTADIRAAVQTYQNAADAKRHTTLLVMAIVCGLVVVGGVSLGALHYLSVVRPLRNLSLGVRRVAAGDFSRPVATQGGDELASLAQDFNRMANELNGFYHQLEQKVAQKSNELVRSERLASVGYLAAGVAHEINNPLGIIAGYAEYSLEQLKQSRGAGDANADLIKSLQVICDEAFRCKDITGKLLSLARQGDESRRPICLADVADKVVSIISGLREYQDRQLTVSAGESPAREQLVVNAVEAQMQQVVLNLALNALEAAPPQSGRVRIELERQNGRVRLCVSDNGRGMSAETLGRVFEPFFTEKRGSRQAGTGLGLSITHRIVEAHGGTIAAQSDGPGTGSRFEVSLPAAIASSE
jgi:signal transduction histidine kinase